MKRRNTINTAILILCLTVFGCGSGGDEATPKVLATPDQIAQTPKKNAEAEVLTIEATDAFIAPKDVYERVDRELTSIRLAYQDVSQIVALPSWVPQNLLVGFDSTGAAEVINNTYTAWDGLNALYGVTQFEKLSGEVTLLNFGGRFNIPILAREYAKLPHVKYAEPDSMAGDGNDVCLQISGDTHFFIFDAGSGDCMAGCINHAFWGFSVDSSGNITFLGTWQGTWAGVSMPQWLQNLSSCRKWL